MDEVKETERRAKNRGATEREKKLIVQGMARKFYLTIPTHNVPVFVFVCEWVHI